MQYKDIILWFLMAAAIMFVGAMVCGCKSQCVPQIEYVKQDSIITRLRIDSVLVMEKDSVFIERAGDTIYLTKYKSVFKDRIVLHTDTIYKDNFRDVVQTETVRYVPTYYKVCSLVLWVLVVIVLSWIVLRLIRRYYLKI